MVTFKLNKFTFCETVTENYPSKAKMYRSNSKGGLSMEIIAKGRESSNFPCYMSMGFKVLTQKTRQKQNIFLKILFTFSCNWQWIWPNFLKVDHYSTLNFLYQTVYTLHQHMM